MGSLTDLGVLSPANDLEPVSYSTHESVTLGKYFTGCLGCKSHFAGGIGHIEESLMRYTCLWSYIRFGSFLCDSLFLNSIHDRRYNSASVFQFPSEAPRDIEE